MCVALVTFQSKLDILFYSDILCSNWIMLKTYEMQHLKNLDILLWICIRFLRIFILLVIAYCQKQDFQSLGKYLWLDRHD